MIHINFPVLKVGNARWTIFCVENLTDTADSEGQTHHTREEIYLDASLPLERARQVLIHEIIHVCADFAGFKDDASFTEEEFASRIAPVLSMVLTDNTWILSPNLQENRALKEVLSNKRDNDTV